jgi:hypothetical protein
VRSSTRRFLEYIGKCRIANEFAAFTKDGWPWEGDSSQKFRRGKLFRGDAHEGRENCMSSFIYVALATFAGQPSEPDTRPHYLVEIVFIHDGEVFLGQQLLGIQRRELMQAVAFDDDRKALYPPDQGFERLIRIKDEEIILPGVPRKPAAPAGAETTHYFSATAGEKGIGIQVSDLGTGVNLPARDGKPDFHFFQGTLFRIQHVDKPSPPLLQDREYYERRLREILREGREHLEAIKM